MLELGESVNSILGITQNPNTQDYMIVFALAKDGSIRNFMNKNLKAFTLKKKILIFLQLLKGLQVYMKIIYYIEIFILVTVKV